MVITSTKFIFNTIVRFPAMKKETSSGRGRIWLFVHLSSLTPTATRMDFNWMPNTRLWRSLLHVHGAPGPSTGVTLYRRRLGPCTGTPYPEQTDTHDWKHCLPATLLAGGNNDDDNSQQAWHAPNEPKNMSITTWFINFDRNVSAWNEKSTAQTSLFGSCWEIWIKEQPVTYLYPVSMILIKTLWRSGGLPVLMESKVS